MKYPKGKRELTGILKLYIGFYQSVSFRVFLSVKNEANWNDIYKLPQYFTHFVFRAVFLFDNFSVESLLHAIIVAQSVCGLMVLFQHDNIANILPNTLQQQETVRIYWFSCHNKLSQNRNKYRITVSSCSWFPQKKIANQISNSRELFGLRCKSPQMYL